MLDQTLEFAIAQYADGTLPAGEMAALEKRLADEPAARALLEEYRKLDGVVRSAMPVPAIRWEALSTSISSAIDAEEEAAASRMRIGSWFGRAASSIKEVFEGLSWRIAAPVALAAGLLIATGLWMTNRGEQNPANPTPGRTVAVVDGPKIEVAAGPEHASVEIGPPTLASRQPAEAYAIADDLVSVSPHILVIDTASDSGQDSFPIR